MTTDSTDSTGARRVEIGAVAHARPAGEVCADLTVDPAHGLSSDEVARRAVISGANELEPAPRTSPVKLLLDAKADPRARTQDGTTPLILASQHSSSPDLVRLLLSAGADTNARRKDGTTALMLATQCKAPSGMVRALLEARADPNTRSPSGHTALHFVAEQSASP